MSCGEQNPPGPTMKKRMALWRPQASAAAPHSQGLALAHFRAQLEDLRDTSLTLELNLSTFGPHPRENSDYVGDKVSLS